jgi:hypothetical protein
MTKQVIDAEQYFYTFISPMNKLLQNIKVTNEIASLLNSALESGLNPAWFQTDERLNKNGFLDASFATSGLDTPSGKAPRLDWSFRLRLNPDDLGKETKYTVITPKLALSRLRRFTKDKKQPDWLRVKAVGFLQLLEFVEEGNDSAKYDLESDLDFDGVVSDALLQYIVALDVVFG